MAGSANTPPDSSLAQALQQAGIAAFKVTGTGTSLDGKWVLGAVTVDPATGLPAEGTAQVNQRRLDPQDDVVACVPGQVASGATLTNVAASVTSVVLLNALATNIGVTAGRMGAIIVNDSPTATLKIAFAATASATSFTDQILPGQTWEMPPPIYGGIIAGIWDVANGSARITELS